MVSRRRRRWPKILLTVALLLGAGAWWTWRQANRPPVWYAPPDPADPVVVRKAEQVEYGVVQRFHEIRPEPAPWRMEIREDEINAWLAARLRGWAHNRDMTWPVELAAPQVHVRQDGMEVALEVHRAGVSRVFVVHMRPVLADGRIRFDLEGLGMGRVSVPGGGALAGWLDDGPLGAAAGEEVAATIHDLFAKDGGIESLFDLSDGREVELLALTLRDGAIELTCRTAAQESASQKSATRTPERIHQE